MAKLTKRIVLMALMAAAVAYRQSRLAAADAELAARYGDEALRGKPFLNSPIG